MAEAHYPDLAGTFAVVTGGGRGIGWATVARLRAEGADVLVLDRGFEAGGLLPPSDAGWQRSEDDAGVTFAACDVTDRSAVAALAERLRGQRIPDILVCAAGIVRSGDAESLSAADWDDVIAVNLTGLFAVCQAMGSLMIDAGRGSIVAIASMSGLISNVPQRQVSYNASKAGVIHLVHTLAGEWAGAGVRVNAVSPGYIATDLTARLMEAEPALVAQWTARTPLGRLGTPQEVAEVILFLASQASGFMTGSNVIADGGYTVW